MTPDCYEVAETAAAESLADTLAASTLVHALRQWTPAGRNARPAILIFHRVLAERDALFPEEPTAASFDMLLHWLRTFFNVLPLDRLANGLAQGTLPER